MLELLVFIWVLNIWIWNGFVETRDKWLGKFAQLLLSKGKCETVEQVIVLTCPLGVADVKEELSFEISLFNPIIVKKKFAVNWVCAEYPRAQLHWRKLKQKFLVLHFYIHCVFDHACHPLIFVGYGWHSFVTNLLDFLILQDDSRRVASTLFPSLSSQLSRKKDHGTYFMVHYLNYYANGLSKIMIRNKELDAERNPCILTKGRVNLVNIDL